MSGAHRLAALAFALALAPACSPFTSATDTPTVEAGVPTGDAAVTDDAGGRVDSGEIVATDAGVAEAGPDPCAGHTLCETFDSTTPVAYPWQIEESGTGHVSVAGDTGRPSKHLVTVLDAAPSGGAGSAAVSAVLAANTSSVVDVTFLLHMQLPNVMPDAPVDLVVITFDSSAQPPATVTFAATSAASVAFHEVYQGGTDAREYTTKAAVLWQRVTLTLRETGGTCTISGAIGAMSLGPALQFACPQLGNGRIQLGVSTDGTLSRAEAVTAMFDDITVDVHN